MRLCALRKPDYVGLLLISVLAACVGGALTEYIYRGATVTWDESSYLFQSHLFADGHIKHAAPPLDEELERGMIIQHPEQGWLSRYPFVHSLWLVPGVLLNVPRLMVWLAAFLSIMAIGRLGTVLGIRPLMLPIMLATLSMFLAMHGTLLSHTSGLLAVIGMLVCYIQWQQTGRWGFALAAGLLWAAYFNNRTYTAALMAIPLGIDALAQLRRHHWRTYGGQIAVFACAAASGLAVFMLYNRLAVGDWATSTYLFYNPTQNIGFGPRDGRMIHTLQLGLDNTVANLRAFDTWLYGFRYSLVLVSLLALLGVTRRWAFLLLATPLSIVAGYVAFWYPGVHHAGPVYYFELLPFLLAAAAIGLNRILNRLPRAAVLPVACVLTLGLVVSSQHYLSQQRERQGPVQRLKRTVMDTTAGAPEKSLIIYKGMGRQLIHECGLNPNGMQSDPLILVASKRLWNDQAGIYAHMFPERQRFVVEGGRESELQPMGPLGVMDVTLEPAKAHRKCGENVVCPESGALIRRHLDGSAADWSFFGSYLRLVPGAYTADFSISLSDCATNQPVVLDVYQCDSGDTLTVKTVVGSHENAHITLAFELAELAKVEPRVRFGGSGVLTLRNIRVRERTLHAHNDLTQALNLQDAELTQRP